MQNSIPNQNKETFLYPHNTWGVIGEHPDVQTAQMEAAKPDPVDPGCSNAGWGPFQCWKAAIILL